MKKRYRAIGSAYDQLFKAPPPTAVMKTEQPSSSYNNEDPEMADQYFDQNSESKDRLQLPANDLIEDIDISGDPYYLKYYRSFHNHELDPNTILNESQLIDEDMVRTGSLTMLPQGNLAIQYY